ncbi:Na+/H+ antiporter NhaA [Kibdelosporangium philippinense]|uniref:Na(+)/H(+) antiporter NhaA n=1 Tax=Kibdelosporangium philippinense TaxID=211113 RepID=A0ABS8ZQA9_9PSEU|nr:Na+/H+ antiporter NhaA [Kibdelosporangium philippinense]MCE7009373.1 Na+/H+ antiporter NhaA [Kibdelosporangium philippinense]
MRRSPISDFARYLRTETVGGLILLGATAVALLLANSPVRHIYQAVRDFHIWELSVGDWAKDGLLALFFFVAGLELKRELVVGELSRFKAAILPVVAALGGMIVPIGIALAVGWGAPGMDQAWAIPAATDIAFALGVLSITASGLPSSARVFLLSLAVVDDLGAIVIIAILFTAKFNLIAAATAIVLLALYAYLQHKRIQSSWLYVPIALGTWFAVHESGIHATIAGVALGLLTRVRKDPYERAAPAIRLEHRLQPWSAGFAVPVFALFAAGVPVSPTALSQMLDDRVAVAVILGLLVGKLIGIFGATFAAVRLKVAVLPTDLGWRDMAAVSMLGGVGFTVSLLIADLSLDAGAAERVKAAVLLASAAASLLAAAMLVRRSRAHRAS